jgi:hypothetical protein
MIVVMIVTGGSCYYVYNLSSTTHCLSSVKHNPHSGNLRTLVKRCLELATNLRDESQCERLVPEVVLVLQLSRCMCVH